MPHKVHAFSCPVCGMHAPVDRLYTEAPFLFRMYRKIPGGKRKLTDAQREERRGGDFKRGSAPGALEYEEIPMDDELRPQLEARLEDIRDGGLL